MNSNKKLIDAEALKEFLERAFRPLCDDYHMKDYVLDQILTDIENEPAIDAVPVIRCKDCDHSTISATIERRTGEIEPAGYICKMWRAPTRGEGFCHKALPKRKGRDE